MLDTKNARNHPGVFCVHCIHPPHVLFSFTGQEDQMLDGNDLLSTFTRHVVDAVHPLRIILFGSWATGHQNENSDLDALVIMPDGSPCRKTAADIYIKLAEFGYAVDIVVATPSILERQKNNTSMVYYQAMQDGRELYHAAI